MENTIHKLKKLVIVDGEIYAMFLNHRFIPSRQFKGAASMTNLESYGGIPIGIIHMEWRKLHIDNPNT